MSPIAQSLLTHPRWVLVTHRQADGDALGSLLGLRRLLSDAGVEVIAYHPEPVSPRLRALETGELIRELPPSVRAELGGDWPICVLDCGDQGRICAPELRTASIAIQLDHHNGNPHYAAENLVDVDASSTAELVWRIGGEILAETSGGWTRRLGDPLWVGLVTDAGGFGYEKAGADCHRMAAELIDAGVEPSWWRAELYGRQSLALMRARAKAVETMRVVHDGRVAIGVMTLEILRETGLDLDAVYDTADELRDIDGVRIAVGGRPLADGTLKCSLRTDRDDIDLTSLAQALGGGGHRRASGFLWQGTAAELVSRIEMLTGKIFAEQLAAADPAFTPPSYE